MNAPDSKSFRSLPSDVDHSGRNFDKRELDNLRYVIESGTLNCTKGTWVKTFESKFSKQYGVKHTRAVTSGTAAIHTAVAAINPEPGDEIITTPITDMGAIAPILYQAAIPVFVDVDPNTFNITAKSIAQKITPRTRAIIVTHLFGFPCDMDPILELAAKHSIPVIEDAAQAYYTEYRGRRVGSIGDIACFSLQQGKHMTTGEGGLVITNNEKYLRRVNLFVDKAWGYGDENPDHYFLALNYRMTELQGAVALAQLEKVQTVVESRINTANYLTTLIQDLNGVAPPVTKDNTKHVYWKYCLRIDATKINGGVDAFSKLLKNNYNIFSAPRYIQKPAFMCEVIQSKNTFGNSGFPFVGPHRQGLPEIKYELKDFPGTEEALSHICVLPWNENYTKEDVEYIANAVIEVAKALRK